ncbi:MAG: hypothetical protein K940chlam4_00060 [Candidatus Anoxychlamydiales bacterium]|nr:hypothetical protein [Candidatus Anoxychlamydiales bacterium]
MTSPVNHHFIPQKIIEALEDELIKNSDIHLECKYSICSLMNIILTLEPDTKSNLSKHSFYQIGPKKNFLELNEQLKTIHIQEFFKIALAAIVQAFIINSSDGNPLGITQFLEHGKEFLSSKDLKVQFNSNRFSFSSQKLTEIVKEVLDIK